MNDEFRQMVIDALRRGEDLPSEWARELFPPEKREYELVYYGKQRQEDILAETMAVPLQSARTFGTSEEGWHNQLIFGDNLQVMKRLLELKKTGELCNRDGTPGIRLIYIDPPFATKQDFAGSQEQKAYQDKVAGAAFLEFLRKRLVFLHELLADNGSLYIHLDMRKGHYGKVLLDEIFGESNFQNEIIWKRTSARTDSHTYNHIHDTIFLYTKSSGNFLYNTQYTDFDEKHVDKYYNYVEEGTGRRFRLSDLTAAGTRNGATGQPWRGFNPNAKRRHWFAAPNDLDKLDMENRIYWPSDGGWPRYKGYLDETQGTPAQSVWTDIFPVNSQADERTDYPTQKPETLLERILRASSNEGDLVLDAFAGSGTTLAVAEKLGRRWIGIDCGKLAMYTIQKRMLNLRKEIGNKGKPLQPNPFTLYNAGLYDFSKLRQLPWNAWRFFALQLFGCRDEQHAVGGLKLDGKLKGASVLVFNHLEHPGRRIDEQTIESIHAAVGDKVGSKFFIIAPRNVFDFQQDYIEMGDVRYFALRIPYSIVQELHSGFTALRQPADERNINDTVDSVGFDFIQPPSVKWQVGIEARKGQLLKEAFLQITDFRSKVRLRGEDTHGGLETFSMLMLDFNYNGDVFNLDTVLYNHQLEQQGWRAWFSCEGLGEHLMAVFMDIHGNESQVAIPRTQFDLEQQLGSSNV